MIMGDGWCKETQEPPEELSEEYGENVQSFDNGFWISLNHTEQKRLEGRESAFIRDLARVFCQYLMPLKAYRFPFNG